MKVGAHLPWKWRTRLHNALGSDEKFGCVMRLMQQSFPISVGEWTRSPMVVALKKENVCLPHMADVDHMGEQSFQ